MRSDFAVYIISHGRANNLKTLDTLREIGTSYPIYIVIDDEDKQREEYKRRFENVLEFSKKEIGKITDTLDNFKNYASAVYARNFCLLQAREKYKWILMMDDDISLINFRYEKFGSLKSKRISDFDRLCEAYLSFAESSEKIVSVAFCNSGGLIGGLGGKFSKRIGNTINQAFFIRTDSILFRGTKNER